MLDSHLDPHYDVIIIGGRCAGASLALRLAGQKLKILLVDRATFPSLPNVPSAPFIHPGTMRLLDELGLAEVEYAHPDSRIERFVINYVGHFEAVMPTSSMMLDRNYLYGIDRARFDTALWQRAQAAADVTARDGFAVSAIHKDSAGKVTGIVGKEMGGRETTISADLVVGADGRFSMVGKQLGAKVVEERNKYTSAVYHAEWEHVADDSTAHPFALTTYFTGNGFMALAIPISERKYHIGIYMKSAAANFGPGGFSDAYLQELRRIPPLWRRLDHAHCVTNVMGIRPIENGYREAFGANWALVGDAVHYKDPSDGQGMYDALLTSKLLAQAILDWKHHGLSWGAAGTAYQQRLRAATHAMFKQTVQNVQRSLYMNPPGIIIDSVIRWMMSDPGFQADYLRYLSRAIDPAMYKPRPSLAAMVNGIVGDVRQWRSTGSSGSRTRHDV